MNIFSREENSPRTLPNQMASSKTKQSKQWQEDSLNFFISNIYNRTNSLRKSSDEMQANIRLVNSALDAGDLKDAFDPLRLNEMENSENLPIKDKFYNIINNPLKTLFGEELKRRSDIRAIVVNQSAINKKDEEFNNRLFSYLQGVAQQESVDEEDLKKKLAEFDRYKKYDLQSAHEKMANEIIQVLTNDRNINIKRKFNNGWKNLNIIGEEIYRVGNIGNEPMLFNVDSKYFHVLGLGDSNLIQDGYAWIEEDYIHRNKIVEEFNRYLSEKDIKKILDEDMGNMFSGHITPITALMRSEFGGVILDKAEDDTVFTLDGETSGRNTWVNDTGDIRVIRVQWVSLRKIGELKYYDEFGDEQKMFVDEYFKPDITLGQEVEWFYINDIWEGVKIGEDIYPYIRPLEVQMRSLINPSIVKPSYVGVIQTTMGGKARCIVDDIKPYQEDFNVWMLKLKQLWVQHLGKAATIDMSRIPSSMSTEEWFKWLSVFGIAFENPFEESSKGQLSGMMQQNSRHIDLNKAEEINTAIQMLSWLEMMINKIAAIPEPRQGNLEGNEGLGVTQEAITRSSTQTEDVFQLHEDIKALTYTLLIEYTKNLWKDEKGKRQYQLDDLSNYIIDIDGSTLSEAEYGIQITNSSRVYEMENTLKQLSHAGMQNGTITLSDVAKMQLSTSPSEMLKTLEQSEDKRLEQQNQTEQMRIQAQQEAQQQMMQFEQMKHQMELEKMKLDFEYKMQLEKLKLEDKAKSDAFNQYYNDQNRDGVDDQVEIDVENIKKETKLKEIETNKALKEKEFQLKEKIEMEKIKAQKEIARSNAINKPKSK